MPFTLVLYLRAGWKDEHKMFMYHTSCDVDADEDHAAGGLPCFWIES
jgi:hypothetical protein